MQKVTKHEQMMCSQQELSRVYNLSYCQVASNAEVITEVMKKIKDEDTRAEIILMLETSNNWDSCLLNMIAYKKREMVQNLMDNNFQRPRPKIKKSLSGVTSLSDQMTSCCYNHKKYERVKTRFDDFLDSDDSE